MERHPTIYAAFRQKELRGAPCRIENLSAIRHKDVARVVDGPEPDGIFWAILGYEDLPCSWDVKTAYAVTMSWDEFFQAHARAWWRDARGGDWMPLTSPDDIPEIREVEWENYEACTMGSDFYPLVEIYAIPVVPRPVVDCRECRHYEDEDCSYLSFIEGYPERMDQCHKLGIELKQLRRSCEYYEE